MRFNIKTLYLSASLIATWIETFARNWGKPNYAELFFVFGLRFEIFSFPVRASPTISFASWTATRACAGEKFHHVYNLP